MSYHRRAAIGTLQTYEAELDRTRRSLLADMTPAELFRYATILPLPEPEPGEETSLLPSARDYVELLRYLDGLPAEGYGVPAHHQTEKNGERLSETRDDSGLQGSEITPGVVDGENSDDAIPSRICRLTPDNNSRVKAEDLLELQLHARKIADMRVKISDYLEEERVRLYRLFEDRHKVPQRKRNQSNLRYMIRDTDAGLLPEATDDVFWKAWPEGTWEDEGHAYWANRTIRIVFYILFFFFLFLFKDGTVRDWYMAG